MAKATFWQKTLHKSGEIGTRSVLFLAKPWVRPVCISIGIVVALWFLYTSAWVPFQEELVLPSGVTPRNPELQTSVLNRLNTDRVDRSSHRPGNFSSDGTYFAPVVSPGP